MPFTGLRAQKVEDFIKLSLLKLKLDYVDLYLIHNPVGLIGKDDDDLVPVDANGRAVLDLDSDHVAVWKVPSLCYILYALTLNTCAFNLIAFDAIGTVC